MFEKASRLKLRFNTPSGVLTVEDLWDLPMTSKTGKANLDDIARGLHTQLEDEQVSFVEKPAKKNEGKQLAFDIVKHVIEVRLAERDAAKLAEDRRKTKQRIADLIAEKRDEELKGKSLEDLEKMLESL